MPASNVTEQSLNRLSALRKRLRVSLLIVLFTALGPLIFVPLFMMEGMSWSTLLTILAIWLLGGGSAYIMGNSTLGGVMNALENSIRSEVSLRRLMELSGDWYWRQDANQVITRIVFRGHEIQGLGVESSPLPFVGFRRQDIAGLSLAESDEGWDAFIQCQREAEPFDRVVFEYWPEDRPRLIFESSGRPIIEANGRVLGYDGVSTNITQKWLSEKLLSIQRYFLQGVLLSAPLTELTNSYARGLKQCLTVHSELVVGFRENRMGAHWHMRGASPDFRISDSFGEAFWQDPANMLTDIDGFSNNGLIRLGCIKQDQIPENWAKEQNIACVWVVLKKAEEANQPEYWILIAQRHLNQPNVADVTRVLTGLRLLGLCVERRVFEDELQSLNQTLEARIETRTAELTASNKELEAFTYTVSHDLRAPLRAIDGFSTILREDHGESLPPDAASLLDRISGNARQMGGLIDGLLDFSRLLRTELTLVEVNLNQMVANILDQLDAQSRARVTVDDLPKVMADPILLQQVWQNLIDNALKFSAKVEDPQLTISVRMLDAGYEFSVRDNGAGFDMKYADKLFQVFERLHHKRDFDGTGVGLAIVKRIIERHHGQIWADSEPGSGAAFHFTLMSEAA